MPHKKPIAATLLFGIASVVMYTLLLMNSDLFVDWAERTIKGEKSLFLIPVVVAFVFSYFHGTFTGHFWETLGLRAAKTIAHAPAKSGAKK
jgi:hypothetical protein